MRMIQSVVLAVVAAGLVLPAAADAARQATVEEAAGIAEAIDMNPECLIVTMSTVVSSYAKTTIDRSSCNPPANGYFLLRSSAAGWQVLDSGSDDYGPCSGDEKGPAAVLRDLRICAPLPRPKVNICSRKTGRIHVMRLKTVLKCSAALPPAVRVVNNGGYYQSKRWYCRWGQGGTRPIRVNGKVYWAGSCMVVSTGREFSFIAHRPS